jgi:hypothetical protein
LPRPATERQPRFALPSFARRGRVGDPSLHERAVRRFAGEGARATRLLLLVDVLLRLQLFDQRFEENLLVVGSAG